MNTLVSECLTTRPTVKVVILAEGADGEKEVLIHHGTSRLSLLGGGIDEGEDVLEALQREVKEEAGVDMARFLGKQSLRDAGQLFGLVTSREGEAFVADWRVHSTTIDRSQMPELKQGEDVIGYEFMPVEEAVRHPRMSELAREAILRAISSQQETVDYLELEPSSNK